jgi:hypothetical protein
MSVTDGCLLALTGTAVYLALGIRSYIAALVEAEGFWLERRRQRDEQEAEYRDRGFE